MLQYLARVPGVILAFARGRISLLGVRKFATEITTSYVFTEIVDFSASYSEWIDRHSTELKLVFTLGLVSKNTGLALLNKSGRLSTAKILYSKLIFRTPIHRLKEYVAKFATTALANGVEIREGGKLILKIVNEGGKLIITNKSGVLGGSVLAAGLAGAVPGTEEEWEATGQQLTLHLAESASTLAEYVLRTRLNKFSPVTLLRNGALYVDTFLREYPVFSQERAVAILSEVLDNDALRIGAWSVDTFTDVDDVQVIRLDGLYFKGVQGSNTMVFQPYQPKDLASTVAPELDFLLGPLVGMLNKIDHDGGVSLTKVEDTQRYLSTPFIVGDVGLMLAIDNDTGGYLQIISAQDSLFDSIDDNLEDDFGETTYEAGVRLTSELGTSIASWAHEMWTPAEELEKESKEGVYRSRVIYLSAQDLSSTLGKW